jgi:hypothetical protein
MRKVEAIVDRGVNLATLGEGDLAAPVADRTLDADEASDLARYVRRHLPVRPDPG